MGRSLPHRCIGHTNKYYEGNIFYCHDIPKQACRLGVPRQYSIPTRYIILYQWHIIDKYIGILRRGVFLWKRWMTLAQSGVLAHAAIRMSRLRVSGY
jgi:hypothetical protein